jgi:hypothetical protein
MLYGAKTNSTLFLVWHPLKSLQWFTNYASFGHLFLNFYSESTIHKLPSCTKNGDLFAPEALLLINPMVFVPSHRLMYYPSILTNIRITESILEENTLRNKPSILEGDNKLTETLEYDAEILMNEEESSKVCRSISKCRAVELVCNSNHVDSIT